MRVTFGSSCELDGPADTRPGPRVDDREGTRDGKSVSPGKRKGGLVWPTNGWGPENTNENHDRPCEGSLAVPIEGVKEVYR